MSGMVLSNIVCWYIQLMYLNQMKQTEMEYVTFAEGNTDYLRFFHCAISKDKTEN